MKILQIVPGSLQYGVGSLSIKLSEELMTRGHSVKLFCLYNTFGKHEKDFRSRLLIKIYTPIVGDPLYVPPPKLIAEVHREKADIVHVHNMHTLLPAFIASQGRRVSSKLVLQPHYHRYGQNTIRSVFFSVYKAMILPKILKRFNVIIANSKYEYELLRIDFPNISRRVILVPEEYSIDVPMSIKWKPVEPKKILYVGALRSYKNVDIIIRAFKILRERTQGNITLVIVGDGPEREKLQRLAQKLGIYEYIYWKRNLPYDKLLQEYAEASVLISLSTLESFSRVIYEAMAIGTPLVVYNYGVYKELVNKCFAKGVNKLNAIEVANAINEVLDGHFRTSRQYFNNFYKKSYTDLIVNVYQKLVGEDDSRE